MSRKSLDLTLEVLGALDRARTHAELAASLIQAAAGFGVSRVLAGIIPSPGMPASQQRAHVLLDHWPEAWAKRYFAQGYLDRDPTIARVLRSPDPFSWSELAAVCAADRQAQSIMREATEFGLKAGFTVPVATLDGPVAAISLAGDRLEFGPRERGGLALIATYAVARATALTQCSLSAAQPLSPRENEALRWAAEGKSDWEIGVIMGISEHGVDKHMRSARRKLKAVTRAHAVAQAIRLGLVR